MGFFFFFIGNIRGKLLDLFFVPQAFIENLLYAMPPISHVLSYPHNGPVNSELGCPILQGRKLRPKEVTFQGCFTRKEMESVASRPLPPLVV